MSRILEPRSSGVLYFLLSESRSIHIYLCCKKKELKCNFNRVMWLSGQGLGERITSACLLVWMSSADSGSFTMPSTNALSGTCLNRLRSEEHTSELQSL